MGHCHSEPAAGGAWPSVKPTWLASQLVDGWPPRVSWRWMPNPRQPAIRWSSSGNHISPTWSPLLMTRSLNMTAPQASLLGCGTASARSHRFVARRWVVALDLGPDALDRAVGAERA